MKKWKYLFVKLAPSITWRVSQGNKDYISMAQDKANELGEEGWELVNTHSNGVGVFKKER